MVVRAKMTTLSTPVNSGCLRKCLFSTVTDDGLFGRLLRARDIAVESISYFGKLKFTRDTSANSKFRIKE